MAEVLINESLENDTFTISQFSATTITERKCGIADDITHCTLYTMNPKFGRHRNMKRHLLTGNPSITTTGVSRRRESFVVEVLILN